MDLSLHQHINELRKRFLVIIIFLLIFFIVGFSFADLIIRRIIHDLIVVQNVSIIGLTPFEYILTEIKAGFFISLVITLPMIIYQIVVFIRPGLNQKERNAVKLILPTFFLLFIIGIVFAYFIFLPVAIYFLANLSHGIVDNLWSISKFLDFVFLSGFGLGLIFQLPLLLLMLNKLDIMSIQKLKKYRAHVYVTIFVLAAVITPPDFITQLIIGLPLVVLFEVSYWLANLF